jgi:hypothetical protein
MFGWLDFAVKPAFFMGKGRISFPLLGIFDIVIYKIMLAWGRRI